MSLLCTSCVINDIIALRFFCSIQERLIIFVSSASYLIFSLCHQSSPSIVSSSVSDFKICSVRWHHPIDATIVIDYAGKSSRTHSCLLKSSLSSLKAPLTSLIERRTKKMRLSLRAESHFSTATLTTLTLLIL